MLNDKNCITFIEWADMIKPLIPKKCIVVRIKSLGETKRSIEIKRVENE